MKIIDPHLHLFDLNQGQYGWLRAGNPPNWPDKHLIQRNFAENDLELDGEIQLAGFVHIEAGFDNKASWREIDWLENGVKTPFRSIACVDLTWSVKDFQVAVSKLQQHPSFVGVRHILDDDTLAILQHPNTAANLAVLAKQELIFELQMPVANSAFVDALLKLLNQTPNIKLAINHGGWPPEQATANASEHLSWRTNIEKLAALPNCVVKASGWEMIDRQYDRKWQKQVIEDLLSLFGSQRVLLASNFPLTLFSQSYEQLWRSYVAWEDERIRRALCYDNARQFYQLKII